MEQISNEGLSDLVTNLENVIEVMKNNLFRINKEVVTSELSDYIRQNGGRPDVIWNKAKSYASAPVVKPEGMTDRYVVVLMELSKLLNSTSYFRVIRSTRKTLELGLSVVDRYHHLGSQLCAREWNSHVAGYFPKEEMETFSQQAEIFATHYFRTPKPTLARFGNEFPNLLTFSNVIDTTTDLSKHYRDLENNKHDVNTVINLSGKLSKLVQNTVDVDDTRVRSLVADTLSTIGTYLDFYAVTVHELFRIDHNLTVTLRSLK